MAVISNVSCSNSHRIVAWTLTAKLLSDEGQRTSPTRSQHWFRQWLGAVSHQAITWASVDQVIRCLMRSLGHNDLIHTSYISFAVNHWYETLLTICCLWSYVCVSVLYSLLTPTWSTIMWVQLYKSDWQSASGQSCMDNTNRPPQDTGWEIILEQMAAFWIKSLSY